MSDYKRSVTSLSFLKDASTKQRAETEASADLLGTVHGFRIDSFTNYSSLSVNSSTFELLSSDCPLLSEKNDEISQMKLALQYRSNQHNP